jgi:hypothetical protein
MKEKIRKGEFIISFVTSLCFTTRWLLVGFQRALVDESGASHIDIIPPWFSMPVYHLRVEL